ncbi:MAG: ABC-2 family transporter protein [Thermomicrobiales bacterium]
MTFMEATRLIRRLVAIDMSVSLAYRGDVIFRMLNTVLGPLVSVLIWRAALASGAQLPVDGTYLTSYFVLLGAVSMLTSSWLSGFLADMIRNGALSIWLARPGSLLYGMLANNLAEKGFKSLVLTPMILVFGWFLRGSVNLAAPLSHWMLLAISVVLAAVIIFALDMVIGSLAFWIDDVSGVQRGHMLVGMVLAGQVVPLALMPAWASGFVNLQPFRFTISFPLEIIVGDLSQHELVVGFAAQLCYVVLFVVLARWIWRRGQRSYSAFGA